jgi:hypothetical protein
LSNTKFTLVTRSGSSVPLRVSLKRSMSIVTITNYANLVSGTDDSVAVGGITFVAQTGAAVLGQATFRAATGNNETATSLAAQINGHATAGAVVRASATGAVVTIASVVTGDVDISPVYTDNDANIGATVENTQAGSDDVEDIDYIAIGAKVYIDDISGLATASAPGATITDAVYVSGVLTGVDEAAAETNACLVDMTGGL